MTITADFTVQQRIWRGWADPGLPVGAYIASGTVQGDASGGSEIVIFDFAHEGEPVSGRYYNVEQMTAHIGNNSTINGVITAFNWESVGPTGLADRLWSMRLVADGVANAAMDSNVLPKMPIFLGTPQAVADLATQFRFGIVNTLNRVLFAQIQGYIWEPRSVLVEGGLRRPAEALYG